MGIKEEKRNSRSRSLLFGRDSPLNENAEAFKKLQEEVEAYRMQNKFLNNEILELTHLRKVDQQKADLLHEKVQQFFPSAILLENAYVTMW